MTDSVSVDDIDDPAFYPKRPAEWGPLIARALELGPRFSERADAARKARMLPRDNIDALFERRLLRQFQPVSFGGDAAPWGAHFQVGRVLAHACPATAWVSSVVASQMFYTSRYPLEAVEEVFARGPDVLMGNASAPVGVSMHAVLGGFSLSGRWRFLSGADYVDWVLLPATAALDDPTSGHMMLVPKSDFAIDDTWHVVGLQATGSKDIVLKDAFVPAHRAMPFSEFWNGSGGPARDGMFLSRRDLRGYIGSAVMGPLIGTAEGALRAYIGVTRKRVSTMSRKTVADSEIVQNRVGEAAGEIRAARCLMEQQYMLLREAGETNAAFTNEQLIAMNRDRSLAVRLCLDAVERLTRHMGANGLFESNPVHAFHQDLRAAACQIAVNFDRNMAPFGQQALGLPAHPAL